MRNGTILPGISVIVPVYNSSIVLPHLVTELEQVLANCAQESELILVNDASPDQSWQTKFELTQQRPLEEQS